MKNLRWLVILIVLIFLVAGCSTNNSALTNPPYSAVSENINQTEMEKPGVFEKLIADAIVSIPNWIINFIGLQDINDLVYGLNVDNSMAYGLFPMQVWNSIVNIFGIQTSIIEYLLVLAILIWLLIIVLRAGTAEGQTSIRDMVNGFLIYLCAMYFGSYLFQIVFGINTFLIKIGYLAFTTSLEKSGISVEGLNFFSLLVYALGGGETAGGIGAISVAEGGLAGAYSAIITGGSTIPFIGAGIGIAAASLLFASVCFVALFNFQYTMRMMMIAAHFVYFPIVAYSSIFPASRRAFDVWFRSLLSIVLVQGFQALFLGFFYVILFGISFMAKLIILACGLIILMTIPIFVGMALGGPGGVMGAAVSFMGLNGMYGLNKTHKYSALSRGKTNYGNEPIVSGSNQAIRPKTVGQTSAFISSPNMSTLMPRITSTVGQTGQRLGQATVKGVPYAAGAFALGTGAAVVGSAVTAITGNMGMGAQVGSTIMNNAMGISNRSKVGFSSTQSPLNQIQSETTQTKSPIEEYSRLSNQYLAQYQSGINYMNRQVDEEGNVSSKFTARPTVGSTKTQISPYTGQTMKPYITKKQKEQMLKNSVKRNSPSLFNNSPQISSQLTSRTVETDNINVKPSSMNQNTIGNPIRISREPTGIGNKNIEIGGDSRKELPKKVIDHVNMNRPPNP
ncbi:hypothetical protein [Brevibacillus halotolerans]|uniref:hypothetical protein n=1 Tax=Brevibacillus halotolerans TaxID=1507437 RepID=UPI0015EE9F8C|nr:hypothetical protein [Brevibacillus halotolerans]MBA4535478.1 hypothetical protein [Brevibacillus halotolerans]